jgi:hypothetical protein
LALENLAAISAALSQVFAPDLERQYNRLAVTLALIPAERGRGKNAAFDVELSGATADAVEEGSDVAEDEFTTDPLQPATLFWAHYRQSFKLTETEMEAAASSIGSPDVILDMFGERVLNAHHKLASAINQDVLTGTGTNAKGVRNLVGLLGEAGDLVLELLQLRVGSLLLLRLGARRRRRRRHQGGQVRLQLAAEGIERLRNRLLDLSLHGAESGREELLELLLRDVLRRFGGRRDRAVAFLLFRWVWLFFGGRNAKEIDHLILLRRGFGAGSGSGILPSS